jgi:GNAT superfamily N-acetyltransferase
MSGAQAKRTRQAEQRKARSAFLSSKKPRPGAKFWHGGTPGLEPGTVLVGRAEAAASGHDLTHYGLQTGYSIGLTDPGRVYFSSDRVFARGFAARLNTRDSSTGIVFQHGALYRVEPIGDVDEDPDFRGSGVSWSAPQARVIAVEQDDVVLDAYAQMECVGPYMKWSDGSPIYTSSGRYLLSPEQRKAGQHVAHITGLHPWTPVEFINAWIEGVPTYDRPNPEDHAEVLLAGREGIDVFERYTARARLLVLQGVQFPGNTGQHRAEIQALLGDATRLTSDDPRGVGFATHPTDGVIGAVVFTAMKDGDLTTMFIDAIVVDKKWRKQGVGSVLTLIAQQLLPTSPSIVAGHCHPTLGPFFAAAGYSVLKPGATLPIAVEGKSLQLSVGGDHSWFFRQGRI